MLVAVADDYDRAVCFEALMDNRNAHETEAILRLIAGFDKNLTVEGADLSELRAGHFEGVGSGSLPVSVAATCGGFVPRTAEERLTGNRDCRYRWRASTTHVSPR